jgi:mannose-1-phosphate guanylyltransferase/phosphomannomutase
VKALVLSAGYGTRLGELVHERPKPMLDVEGVPVLEYILRQLAKHGFTEILINLHFLPEIIVGYFRDGARLGVKLTYSYEPVLLGTLGAAKQVEALLAGPEPFLLHYGDILTNHDFSAMLGDHRRTHALLTLLLHQRAGANSVAHLAGNGRITGFWERPSESVPGTPLVPWVFSGVALCQPSLLADLPRGTPLDLPRDLVPRLAQAGTVYGVPLAGYRCAIDSPDRLAEAQRAVRAGELATGISSTQPSIT